MSEGDVQQGPASQSRLVQDGQSNARLVRRLLRLTWRYRWQTVRLLMSQCAMLALMLSGLSLIGLGIDVLNHSVREGVPAPRYPLGWSPPERWETFTIIAVLAVATLAVAGVRFVLDRLNTVWKMQLVQSVVVDLRTRVYDKLQELSFTFFDANESGSIINRVTGDVQSVRRFIDGVMVEMLVIGVSLVFFTAYMLSIHVTLTLACLATVPLLWLATVTFSRIVKPAYRRNRELFDATVRTVSENIQAARVIKGFSRQKSEVEKFRGANAKVRDQKYWIFRRVAFFAPLMAFLPQVNLVVLLLFGGWLFMQGQITLGGGLVVFSAVLQQFSTQVGNLAPLTNAMQQSLIGAQRVFEVLDAEVQIQSPKQPVPLERAEGRVQFERVSFTYEQAVEAEPALQSVDLEAEPGQVVAILGATGAGKSTLLSLIPRFYDPTDGRVLVDGVDVRAYDVAALRRNVGMVFQESFLFSTSVAENIAFGHPEASDEQIERAAKVAAAHDFIMELDDGYDTIVGERGIGLSGGQRQRLAIARAILLEPAILLLDDPTAAIDPGTESQIMAAMDNAMRGRTTFVVAHRLSTLKRADKVVVMEQGRIVQQGSHEQLMAQDGHYRQAAAMQLVDDDSKRLLGMQGEAAL